ncbi:hypothetical protein [Winogradskyella psychrotolerans]|uniref:hypothetical protein n=1 Tax=Winogradskyella psychrotolerans TaxID=1344585 RepID=UPI001C06F3A1|nr:hypothetical protein [Winogradskyella psychrotolerans]MBU2930223.1 hypothetical protein [Winogradskyella psychrotolerans]
MKTKLHFGLLIILLAFLGTYLEQYTQPNQQIVIQFSDTEISPEDTENAIEVIQNKLQSIGVTHIQIGQRNEGQLRIVYHSTTDVGYIQKALFNVEDLNIAYNSTQNQSDKFPTNKDFKDYELNISEIKTSNTINWDFERTQVVEIHNKTDRFLYSKTNSSGHHYHNIEHHFTSKVAVFINNSETIVIDAISYIIPEVRAGPIA